MMKSALFICFAVLLGALPEALAADNFDRWRPSATNSVADGNDASANYMPVDHTEWNILLSRYVIKDADGVNKFKYKSFAPQDYVRLNAYIAMLEKTIVSDLVSDVQLAYWINMYNAITVRVILEHYPLDSIRDIRFVWHTRGPWKKKLTNVEGTVLSLDDIEHRIVRPLFGDNRTHYALNCASISCPNLQTRAYTHDNLEQLLDAAAREYINHPRAVRFNIDNDALIVSSLYKWYEKDFGANTKQVIEHLMQYAQPALRRQLARANKIDEFFYDWSLNDG